MNFKCQNDLAPQYLTSKFTRRSNIHKALWSDDRLLCDIEISGKTQNYRLKSVCNFKLTRFYLILPCKQYYWTPGTYSIEISTWSYENRVNKHVVIFLNFPPNSFTYVYCGTCLCLFFFFSFFVFACFVVTDLCRSGCIDSSPIAHLAEGRMGY